MSFWREREFRRIIIVFLIAKLFVVAIAVGTQFAVPAELVHTEKITDNIFLNPFAQYDSTAYLNIAENGYNTNFGGGNYHWYPLYPLLIRSLDFVGYPLAAFLISNIASFLAVTILYLLVRDELGKHHAYKTLLYTMLFPTAFYFTMMYTESLFLFLSASVFYFAKKENWLAVGVFGFLVALTRMQGILLIVPALIIYLRSIGFKMNISSIKKLNRNILFLALIPLGILTFMAYELAITGDALIQFKSAVLFGKYLTWPWAGFEQAIMAMANDTTLINLAYHVYNLFITISFIALVYISYKKLKIEYAAYFGLSVLIILLSSNLFGASRYFLLAFPAFMTLSLIGNRNRTVKYGIIALYAIFIVLSAGFVVLHVTERASFSFLYTPLF